MRTPDRDDLTAARDRRRVDLAKGRRDLRPAGAPTGPGATAWAPPTPAPPPRGRSRRVALLVLAVVVVVAAAAVTAVVLWPGDSSTTADPAATSSSAASPGTTLSATDRLVRGLQVGQCLAMTDRLDDVPDPAATTVACTSSAATFTVTEVNQKLNARQPCRSEEFLRSLPVRRVACLDRYLQSGQCVLGNGVQQFLVSAVACDDVPVAPFTEVFRIGALNQSGTPVTCRPPLLLATATPNRSMCLAKVR